MLRAMWEALQQHAAMHPGEPFDHEGHMPDCMREARDDPATWASGGAGGMVGTGGGVSVSETAKEAVVAELRRLTDAGTGTLKEEASLLMELKDLIGKGTEGPGYIPKAVLLPMGKEPDIEKALKAHVQIPDVVIVNLDACIRVAWPGCTIKKQGVRGGSIRGHKFDGYYVDGLAPR